MPFSPREVENKEFVVSFRGYDRDEVRAFLRAAAADYAAALDAVPTSGEVALANRGEREAAAERDEAERHAAGIREAVETFANEQLADVARRTAELRALEERIAQRLYFLQTTLDLARRDLRFDASTSSIFTDQQGDLPVSASRYLRSSAPAEDG